MYIQILSFIGELKLFQRFINFRKIAKYFLKIFEIQHSADQIKKPQAYILASKISRFFDGIYRGKCVRFVEVRDIAGF